MPAGAPRRRSPGGCQPGTPHGARGEGPDRRRRQGRISRWPAEDAMHHPSALRRFVGAPDRPHETKAINEGPIYRAATSIGISVLCDVTHGPAGTPTGQDELDAMAASVLPAAAWRSF